MKSITVLPFLVAAALAGTIALTNGHYGQNENSVPVWAVIGIDHSVSAKDMESGAACQTCSLAMRLDPDDHLTLFRVDHSALEFFDGQPPSSRDSLVHILIQSLRKPPAAPGTRPSLFWNAAVARVAKAQVPVVIVYYSDGQDDDASVNSRRVTRQAALALAKNPYVIKVAVIGAEPETWARIRADFAPLGERLLLSPSTSPNMDEIIRKIDDARNQHREVER